MVGMAASPAVLADGRRPLSSTTRSRPSAAQRGGRLPPEGASRDLKAEATLLL